MWGEVVSVWICLDPAILGPQNSSKLPKMAYFGSFCPFDTLQTKFLAGTNWISPKNYWQCMGEVFKIQNKLDPAIFWPKNSSKCPKITY